MADEGTKPAPLDLAHHVMYGQTGSPPTERVAATSWNIAPFKNPVSAPWNAPIPAGELPKLLNGFLPQEMEDKWFVYADGPDTEGRAVMHFHRSWTGRKVMEVEIHVREEGRESHGRVGETARIVRIVFESREDWFGGAEWAKETVREVCRWVLHVRIPDEGMEQEGRSSPSIM